MEDLKVGTWVAVRRGCPMRCRVHDGDDVVFVFGGLRDDFEFVFDGDALRRFVELGTGALRELDALIEADEEHSDDALVGG